MKKYARYRVSRSLICALLLSGLLVAGGVADFIVDDHYTVTPSVPQTPAYNDLLQRNLDLRVAAKATYKAPGPLVIQKDYGVINGVKRKLVSFQAQGLKEYAYVTYPTTPMPAKGYPVVILCHGFVRPNRYASEGNGYLPDMQYYSNQGFVVLRPDFRGHGLSEGIAEGAYYSMAYNVDIMYLLSSIKQSPQFDKGNINLWGHSMGAYIALRAAVISSDIRSVVMLAGPVGSLHDMFTLYVPPSDRLNPRAQQLRAAKLAEYGTPVSNPKYWANTSPLNYLNKTKAFMQMHVGTADEVVPPVFSKDLDEALSKVKKPHDYFVYEGADHGLVAERDAIWRRSLVRISGSQEF